MATKHKILFICQHNSGRSQIAEAYLRKFAGDRFKLQVILMIPSSALRLLSQRGSQSEDGCALCLLPFLCFQLRYAATPGKKGISTQR